MGDVVPSCYMASTGNVMSDGRIIVEANIDNSFK